MADNVIDSDAFINAEQKLEEQKEKDEKNMNSAKLMKCMMENLTEVTADRIIELVKSENGVDLSKMKNKITKTIESGMMMSLLIPLMCH